MVNRATKLRWRRRFHRRRRQVEDMGAQADEHIEKHFFRRFNKIPNVRRFLFSWVFLVASLIALTVAQIKFLPSAYQSLQPVPGGVYTEGILGIFTNANPIYATSSVDRSVSKLLFSGLLKYDGDNRLVGDLAKNWKVDKSGRIYTVVLRNGLVWQDNQPLTADDVVFTYKMIQNPDAKSPLGGSFQDVQVTALNSQTIQFALPSALSSFPQSLTNGIVPKHILGSTSPEQMRSVDFNTNNPIGSGPFRWDAIEVAGNTPETREEIIGLLPFDRYWGGRPKLNKFVIKSFHDKDSLIKAFKNQDISAAVGLSALPGELDNKPGVYAQRIPLKSEVMVFMRNQHPILQNSNVRRALTMATDRAAVLNSLDAPSIEARGPLLKGQIGYNPKLVQLGYNVRTAQKLLDKAGWKVGPDGIRMKGVSKLSFTLFTQTDDEYEKVAQLLREQWRKVGVETTVVNESEGDLQKTISQYSYDILLYGINIGPDPDVFAYWHSSQASLRATNRLNLSQYTSTTADKSLEAGRTRFDPAIRALKYQPFLKVWRQDAPAVALYQPNFLYITRGKVFNMDLSSLTSASDRYADVQNWMIKQARVDN